MQNSKNKSILIVDDTASNIKFLGSILKEQNYDVEFALDGFEALNWLKEKSFDLILLDIMMPNMDGFEVCSRIKQKKEIKDIPIIFLTAKVDPQDIIKGFEVGGVDYVTKPFNSHELLLRIKTHLEIQHQKKLLQELNATKDKFFNIIAHDLINPISALNSFIEIQGIALRNKEFDKAIDYQSYIEDASSKSFDLLTNLLTWGRIQTNRIEFNPVKINISNLVNEIIALVNHQAASKKLLLENNIENEIVMTADLNMMSTIIRNIISNSIKFCHQGGIISIDLHENDRNYTFSIKDNGIGISEENIEKIFKIDGNFSTLGTNKEKGTGIGLILTQEFVKLHGGKIWVESQLNKYTIFHFTIPKLSDKI